MGWNLHGKQTLMKKIRLLFLASLIIVLPQLFFAEELQPVEPDTLTQEIEPEEIHPDDLPPVAAQPENKQNESEEILSIQPENEQTLETAELSSEQNTKETFEIEPQTSETNPETDIQADKKSKKAKKAKTSSKKTKKTTAKKDDEQSENDTQPKNTYIALNYEGMERAEVDKFRKQYLSEKWSALLYSYLESAMDYRLYVRKAVQDKELPEILEYLPVVESNYKTNAKSRSGAIGMWQFMENSVYPFLKLNDFVDERLDPWKSTDAALKKLEENYKTFGDWLLAIAAYNCGAGALTRALKKAEEKNFWYLVDHKLIPSQTANYVPKLLAIADLAINSEYYGINLPSHKEEFEILENEKNGIFDYVTVNKAYSITQLAQEIRMDAAALKRLNPSYTLGMTHPSKPSEIRLPLGLKTSASEAIKNLTPIDFPIKYKVVAGDSLWSISRKYNVTVQALCDINNIKENAILKIGKILYIPKK